MSIGKDIGWPVLTPLGSDKYPQYQWREFDGTLRFVELLPPLVIKRRRIIPSNRPIRQ